MVTVNTSAKNGVNGREGAPFGGHGVAGTNGMDALPLHVILKAQDALCQIEANGNGHAVPLKDRTQTIDLFARGGHGGHGGKGARGAVGQDGKDGKDADAFSTGTDGTSGTDGARGGDGGAGGKGGAGAPMTVSVAREDLDLLTLLGEIDTSKGRGGQGGSGGLGGQGGKAGRGGSSYSWQTEEPYGGVDEEGGRKTRMVTHTNAAGSDGKPGRTGPSGKDGAHGKDGQEGSFSIEVLDPKKTHYSSMYKIEIQRAIIKDQNDDGIIEPGERITVELEGVNSGGCIAPDEGKISTQLLETGATTGQLPAFLKPQEVFTSRLRGQIPLNARPNTKLTLQFNAYAPRTDKVLAESSFTTEVMVRHPMQLSPIRGRGCIQSHELAPLALRINNVSNGAIGPDRKFYVKLHATGIEEEQLYFQTKEGNTLELSEAGTSVPVTIDGQGSFVLAGAIGFKEGECPPYTRIQLRAELFLEPQEGKQEPRRIQTQSFDLDVAEGFHSDGTEDVLLIIDRHTPDVNSWKWFAEQAGLRLSIWNRSLYNGVSLEKPLEDGNTLGQLFAKKTVIDLTRSASRQLFPTGELYRALLQGTHFSLEHPKAHQELQDGALRVKNELHKVKTSCCTSVRSEAQKRHDEQIEEDPKTRVLTTVEQTGYRHAPLPRLNQIDGSCYPLSGYDEPMLRLLGALSADRLIEAAAHLSGGEWERDAATALNRALRRDYQVLVTDQLKQAGELKKADSVFNRVIEVRSPSPLFQEVLRTHYAFLSHTQDQLASCSCFKPSQKVAKWQKGRIRKRLNDSKKELQALNHQIPAGLEEGLGAKAEVIDHPGVILPDFTSQVALKQGNIQEEITKFEVRV